MKPMLVLLCVAIALMCLSPAIAAEPADVPEPAPVYDPPPAEPPPKTGELVVLEPLGEELVFGYRYGIVSFSEPIEVKAADELLPGMVKNLGLDLYACQGIHAGVSTEVWTDALGPLDVGVAITTLSPYGLTLVWDAGLWEVLEYAGEPVRLGFHGSTANARDPTVVVSWEKAW